MKLSLVSILLLHSERTMFRELTTVPSGGAKRIGASLIPEAIYHDLANSSLNNELYAFVLQSVENFFPCEQVA